MKREKRKMCIATRCRLTKPAIFTLILGIILINLVYFIIINETIAKNYAATKTQRPKFVLYWSPFWTKWDYFMGYGFEPFEHCEYKNCFATKDRKLIPLDQFDALLFHAHAYNKKKHGVPELRSPHQIYIYVNIEAPVNNCPAIKPYNGYFNWTMSYRFDSDIIKRHGYVIGEQTSYALPSQKALYGKVGLAAWLVSNCHAKSRRELLGEELQKYMPVDVYGSCGKLRCSRKKGNSKISSPECYDMLEKNYKFYLSFENSYCRDYASEKLYSVLQKDLVPVVYGDGSYALGAPPNSVINVDDFASVEKLAEYLKYLDANQEEYLKYFEWKKRYRVSQASPDNSPCQICKKLHEPIEQSVYYDLHEWWWGKNKSMCKVGKDLPKIVGDLLETS